MTPLPTPARKQLTEELRTTEQLAQLLAPTVGRSGPHVGTGTADRSGVTVDINNPTMRLQMINVQEFARRLSTLGADAFTSDDVVDLATTADVRISADLAIDATLAQRLLDQISPTLPVTGAQITASQWPPPKSSRPAAPSVSFSSPGAVDGPADQPTRPRSSGPARSGRRPGSRRTGR
ncbi:hypothetical protein ACIA5D_39635 [Actinoplanes sp. NPDC051513]|uniref:hypothetical protein n=1 Tax=Actinoplanes sp. NPDC051513 TaxID=3363908 RepID=UPI0037AFE982